MLVKILGAVDIIAGFILIFGTSLSDKIFVVFGIILLVKSSLGFLKDFASWVDLLTGLVFLLLTIISVPWAIGLILGILIIQKGLFSFL